MELEINPPPEKQNKVCSNCSSVEFRLVDGFYFCCNCGERNGNLVVNTSNSHTCHNEVHSKQNVNYKKILNSIRLGKSVPWFMVEAYQVILKAHIDALIDMGFNEHLRPVAMHIWFRFLENAHHVEMLKNTKRKARQITFHDFLVQKFNANKVCEKNKRKLLKLCISKRRRKRLRRRMKYQQQSSDDNSSDANADSTVELSAVTDDDSDEAEQYIREFRKQQIKNQRLSHRTGWDILTLPKIIVICYLALQWCRELVIPADLIRWSRSGLLPYLTCIDLLPPHMKLSTATQDCKFLTAEVPTHELIVRMSGSLGHSIGIHEHMPETNIKLLIARFLHELNLPIALMQIIDVLHSQVPYSRLNIGNMVTKGHIIMSTAFVRGYFPDIYAVSFIVVALKLLYVMDDYTQVKTQKHCPLHKKDGKCKQFDFQLWLLQLKKKLLAESRNTLHQANKHSNAGDVCVLLENFNSIICSGTTQNIPARNIQLKKSERKNHKGNKRACKVIQKLHKKQGSLIREKMHTRERESSRDYYYIGDDVKEDMVNTCIAPVIAAARRRTKQKEPGYLLYTSKYGRPCKYQQLVEYHVNTDALNLDSISNEYRDIINLFSEFLCIEPLPLNEFILLVEKFTVYDEIKLL